jgi:hypothetical protein
MAPDNFVALRAKVRMQTGGSAALHLQTGGSAARRAKQLLAHGMDMHARCVAGEGSCDYGALAAAYFAYEESLRLAELPHCLALVGLAGFQLVHDGGNAAAVSGVTAVLEEAIRQQPQDWLSLMLMGMHHRYHVLVAQEAVFWPAVAPVAPGKATGSQVQAVATAQRWLLRAADAMASDVRAGNRTCFKFPHARLWASLQVGQEATIQALLEIDEWLVARKVPSMKARVYRVAAAMRVWPDAGGVAMASAEQLEARQAPFLRAPARQWLVMAS